MLTDLILCYNVCTDAIVNWNSLFSQHHTFHHPLQLENHRQNLTQTTLVVCVSGTGIKHACGFGHHFKHIQHRRVHFLLLTSDLCSLERHTCVWMSRWRWRDSQWGFSGCGARDGGTYHSLRAGSLSCLEKRKANVVTMFVWLRSKQM